MADDTIHLSHPADPSLLTTQLMLREVAALKAIFDERFDSITVRLVAMDKAQNLFETNLTRVPTEVDKQISHVREVVDKMFSTVEERFSSIAIQFQERDIRVHQMSEALDKNLQAALATVHQRFSTIDTQFVERDTRTEQIAQGSEKAINAALAAAKEAFQEQNRSSALAIAKSEAATMKSIDQLTTLFQTAIGGMGEQVGDLKGRVLLIEGRTVGLTAAQQTQQVVKTSEQASSSYTVTIIGLIVASIIGIGGLMVSILLRK